MFHVLLCVKRRLQFGMRNWKNMRRIADESTITAQAAAAIDDPENDLAAAEYEEPTDGPRRPGRAGILCFFGKAVACFLGQINEPYLEEMAGDRSRSTGAGLRPSVNWFSADPAIADRNHLIVHSSMRYAIFI